MDRRSFFRKPGKCPAARGELRSVRVLFVTSPPDDPHERTTPADGPVRWSRSVPRCRPSPPRSVAVLPRVGSETVHRGKASGSHAGTYVEPHGMGKYPHSGSLGRGERLWRPPSPEYG
jgi:hypothetical protein